MTSISIALYSEEWRDRQASKAAVHPFYPTQIPNQDAYTKRTSLWVGGGFHHLPPQRRVSPVYVEWVESTTGKRRRCSPILYSGGAEGKAARIATPRGFSEAIARAYAHQLAAA